MKQQKGKPKSKPAPISSTKPSKADAEAIRAGKALNPKQPKR